jgi:hypothetical protein
MPNSRRPTKFRGHKSEIDFNHDSDDEREQMKPGDELARRRLAAVTAQLFDVMDAISRDGLTAEVKAKQKAANAAYHAAVRDMKRIISEAEEERK